MILRPGHYYSFWRIDKTRKDDPTYHNEILSDSWGDGATPQDRLLWDDDVNSGDIFAYSEIYPELVAFVNQTNSGQFKIVVRESADLENAEIIDFDDGWIGKLDDLSCVTTKVREFILHDPYSQYFLDQFVTTDLSLDEEKLKSLKSTPFLDEKSWKIGDIMLYCIVENKVSNEECELTLVTLSKRHLVNLRKNYKFVRFATSNLPIFKLKELNE
jgi:hypothetical protein